MSARRDLFNSPDKMIAETVTLGGADGFPWSILVVDHLLANPAWWRELGRSLSFQWARAAYPGLQASIQVPGCLLLDAVAPALEAWFADDFGWLIERVEHALLPARRVPLAQCIPACRARPPELAGTFPQYDIDELMHFSVLVPSPGWLAGTGCHTDGIAASSFFVTVVVYLFDHGQGLGGTEFFQHQESGLVAIPAPDCELLPEVLQRHGCSTRRQLQLALSRQQDGWRLIHTVPARLGRVVVFPGAVFHRIERTGQAVAAELAERRMTMNATWQIWTSPI